MLIPSLRSRRRGQFGVRSIGSFVLLLCLIGLRIWARSERTSRHQAESVKPDPGAVARIAADQAALAYKEGRYNDAIAPASAAIAADPNYFPAYIIRCGCYRRTGNLDAALVDATRAAALRGSDPEMPVFRASLLMEMKRFPEAEDDFTRSITMRPGHPGSYMGRAEARLEQSKLDLAEADMNKVFQLATASPEEMDDARALQKRIKAALAGHSAEAPPGK